MNTAKSDIEWGVYGNLDYGASHDVSAGIQEWWVLKKHLKQCGLTAMGTCVELGCGAGRLTAALAKDFGTVHALDISPRRIAQARTTVGCDNVTFHRLREPVLPLANAVADLCISTHVLQHISDDRVVNMYLRELRRVLRPAAYFLVHVPVIGAHGMTGKLGEVARRRCKEILKQPPLFVTRRLMQIGFNRLPWKIDQYRVFSFVEFSARLRETGFAEIELRILPCSGGHGYVFAQAATGGANIDSPSANG
jgi:ubiquinone/menaquinone biosynthesis C-methylase UbiE